MITLINNKKISLHGGGKAKKNFIYIDDVSNGEYLVLDKGKIIENGNHQALMENKAHYYRLWVEEKMNN